MKHTTRILALLLALVLCLGLSVTAFATEGATQTTGNCSITVENAKKDQTYKLYKMLDLTVNVANEAYSYTLNSDWTNFFTAPGKGSNYVDIADGYVTWKTGANEAAFAKDAEDFAKTLTAKQEYTAQADGSHAFTGLEAGYYLVTSTLGTKAAVNTTPGAQNPTIREKNGVPSNEKKVEEDSEAGKTDAYGYVNDADIGQKVNFQSTITARTGAENYVFHDTMSTGLTFDANSVEVKKNGNTVTAQGNYTLKTQNTTSAVTDGCTFEVVFEQTFCDNLEPNDKIVISYSATLNTNAVVGDTGNSNESKLTYGENGQFSTTPSKTTTYTWAFDVLKIGNSDHNKPLENAQFVVLNHEKSEVAKFTTGGKFDGWTNLPGENAGWDTTSVLATNAQGKIHVEGLDSGNYWLKEVKAPDGYNMLKEEKQVVIVKTKAENKLTLSCAPVTVEVNNQSGALLPSTGGMGTTIFYVLGGILAVGAAVLLVTKKRMERI